MKQTKGRTASILLVDDDEIDVRLILRGISKTGYSNEIRVAENGHRALQILRGEGGQNKLPRPYVILLDWNMPEMNGEEFLKELREDPELKDSVVWVLTTSGAHTDKQVAFHYNIAGYIIKDNAGNDYLQIANLLETYRSLSELPDDKRLND